MERDGKRVMLLAVKTVFMFQYFIGLKTIDIRRIKPTLAPPYRVLFYAPGLGVCGKGMCRWEYEIEPGARFLWAGQTGMTQREIDRYVTGGRSPVGLQFDQVEPMQVVSLAVLREMLSGFRAPQSYRYLAAPEAALIEEISSGLKGKS